MATDYVVFIHGVNNRVKEDFEEQAMKTFIQIKSRVNSAKTLKPVFLFWGDVAEKSIEVIFKGFDNSPTWGQFWFREFRSEQVVNFVGDAALYLSRNVSVEIIQKMTNQALKQMGLNLEEMKNKSPDDGDRLHLVTHSWGTVILFDIMFASRWEDPGLPQEVRDSVDNLRNGFFGIGKPEIKDFGIPIASIHTMGSPIALFNLLNASGAKSAQFKLNLTPKLQEFLNSLYQKRKKVLPWRNYAHPGDPIAYPLKGVMDLSLDRAKDLVQIEDIITPTPFWEKALGQNILSIINGGKAHGSYWTTPSVAQIIGDVIKSS